MMTNPNQCQFRHGSGNVSATIVANKWTLVIAACTGAQIKISANGADPVLGGTDNSFPAALAIGTASNSGAEWYSGYLSRMHMWDYDHFATNEGRRIIGLYKGLAAKAYNIAIPGY